MLHRSPLPSGSFRQGGSSMVWGFLGLWAGGVTLGVEELRGFGSRLVWGLLGLWGLGVIGFRA